MRVKKDGVKPFLNQKGTNPNMTTSSSLQNLFWMLSYHEAYQNWGWSNALAWIVQGTVYALAAWVWFEGYVRRHPGHGLFLGFGFVLALLWPEFFILCNALTWGLSGDVLGAYLVSPSDSTT